MYLRISAHQTKRLNLSDGIMYQRSALFPQIDHIIGYFLVLNNEILVEIYIQKMGSYADLYKHCCAPKLNAKIN